MGKPKCNLTEEERKRILPKIESWITADEEDELLRHFPQYLFYWYDNGKRQTYCSACGQRNRGAAGTIRHGKKVLCLACTAELEAKAANRYQYDMKSLATWGKAAFLRTDEEGSLLIMTADVLRYFTHDNLKGEIDLQTRAKYYFAPGKAQMWTRSSEYLGDGKWMTKARAAKTVGEGFPQGFVYGFMPNDGNYLTVGMEKIGESSFRYCGIEDWFGMYDIIPGEDLCRYVISYLAQAAMRPQIEMVTKMRLRKAVDELVEEGRTNRKYLNWNARTPAGFLRMTKQEAKLFLHAGMDIDELRLWRNRCAGMPMAEYVEFRDEFPREREAEVLLTASELAGIGLRKARRYALRFPKNSREARIREWADYLGMAQRLGYDLSEETVAMPRDLHDRHDEAAAADRYRVSEMKNRIYSERLGQLRKRYEFRTDTLSVLVPGDLREIVQEGNTLHHCVGGYAERHAEGKTCILFVRKSRTPERSFLTMEVDEKNMAIIQIHGYKNERYPHAVPPKERYRDFLDSWRCWVEAGSRRDRQGRPVLPG